MPIKRICTTDAAKVVATAFLFGLPLLGMYWASTAAPNMPTPAWVLASYVGASVLIGLSMYGCALRWKPNTRHRRWLYSVASVAIYELSCLAVGLIAIRYGSKILLVMILPVMASNLGLSAARVTAIPSHKRQRAARAFDPSDLGRD
jgi:hypothetical protein